MSAAKLLYLFGIFGVKCKSFYEKNGCLYFEASMKKKNLRCPKCKSKSIHLKGSKQREFKMVPWGKVQCFLLLQMHRIYCHNCQKCFWLTPNFTSGKHRYVNSFSQYALELVSISTISSVAQLLNVGWDLIKDIHKKHLLKKYKTISLKKLKYLSVDEFSIRKGHSYMTIFVDIETGRIVHAVEGRKEEMLLPFLIKLASQAKNLKAIAMDLSVTYYSAIQKALPKIDIVFDHFHVDALINKALDEIRKTEQFKYKGKDRHVIKGKRFLLLKNYVDLDKNQQELLEALLKVNYNLFIAYVMKEQFKLFWKQKSIKSAARFFFTWFLEAFISGIKPLVRVATTLLRCSQGLLNYFKHRISNGKTEGLNNKIKTMKRQAYGFRDMEYFILRLYHLHQQGYSLTG